MNLTPREKDKLLIAPAAGAGEIRTVCNRGGGVFTHYYKAESRAVSRGAQLARAI